MKPPLMLTAQQTPEIPVEAGPAPEPPQDTAVLIVGAGPTGLTLASFLAQRGIPFVIVDRRPAGSTASRGAVIHSRTLQVLDRVGIGAKLVERGVIMPRFTMRQRHRAMLTVPFGGVPGPYGYSASVPQNITEQVFTTHLATSGNQVYRGWEVVELQVEAGQGSSPEQVSAVLVDGAGRRRSITARFLVGCDGLHSRVRELSGIGFTGTRYSQTFEMADVRMDWPLPRDGVDLTMSADGLLVVFPLPDEVFRIIATVRSDSVASDTGEGATGTSTAEPEPRCHQNGSSGSWTGGGRAGAAPGSLWPAPAGPGRCCATCCGPPASASRTGWPIPSGPARSSSPGMRLTSTARPAVRA